MKKPTMAIIDRAGIKLTNTRRLHLKDRQILVCGFSLLGGGSIREKKSPKMTKHSVWVLNEVKKLTKKGQEYMKMG